MTETGRKNYLLSSLAEEKYPAFPLIPRRAREKIGNSFNGIGNKWFWAKWRPR